MFNKKLLQLRLLGSMTQDDVLFQMRLKGVKAGKQTYVKWEKGLSEPNRPQLEALIEIFGVEDGYFFDKYYTTLVH